ncbi:class I SAM-dependent methyltransferase [Ruegeria hyattellae]|uniref:class I SAM-dependent methyltransferase n=1 Tax=Ruegeria hyattellae TaxID=3233337 RepID=UPI00355B6BC7
MTATAKFWDGIAEKYARSPIKDMTSYEHTLERTASYLKPHDHVLELGCGTGTTALKLATNVARVVATDLSPGMIRIGKHKAAELGVDNVSFQTADVGKPPQGSFDVAIAFNLLHLVEDLEASLRQVHATLKPGGLFISKTFCAQSNGSLKYRAIRLVLPVMQLFGRAPYVRFMQEKELETMIECAGFTLIERDSFPAKDARRLLVARKT